MTSNSSHNHPYNSQPDWDALRDQNFDRSFEVVQKWIKGNERNIKSRVAYKKRRSNRIVLSLVSVLVLLIGSTFFFKTEKILKYGDMVYFTIDKNNQALIKQLAALQEFLNVGFFEFSKKEQSFLSYVSVITNERTMANVNRELRSLKGISQLEVNAVEYKVRESLFTGFVRKTFHILPQKSKPKTEELGKNIKAQLRKKGIDVKVSISDNDEQLVLTANEQSGIHFPDDNVVNDPKDSLNEKQVPAKAESSLSKPDALDQFNWLPGSWKVKNVPNETWHYWLRVNDTVLKCFVVEVARDEKTTITVGFSIRHTAKGEDILSLKGSQWKFIHAYENSFVFRNDAEANPNVNWILKDGSKTWQSMISSEGNAEFINLVKQDNDKFKQLVNDYSRSHPDKFP